jgi:hypothetical protein
LVTEGAIAHQTFEQILMRKTLIALITLFLGILYAAIWTKILDFAFNYRVIENYEGVVIFSGMFIYFYYSGVYLSAAIFSFFKRERDINSSALGLVYSVIKNLTVSFIIVLIITFAFNLIPLDLYFILAYILLGILLTFYVLVIRTAEEFETNKSLKYFITKIVTVLLVNLILLLVVCSSNFPGVNAPIELRQKWAYKEFSYYSYIVDYIKESNQITAQIGQIIFVAPTKGRNLYIAVGGSSGSPSEFTLEVVGEKGTGTAYVISYNGGLNGMCFEYQGKKAQVTRWGSGRCSL